MSTRRQIKKVNTSLAAREGKRSPLCSDVSGDACGQSSTRRTESQVPPSRACMSTLPRPCGVKFAHGPGARSAPLRIRSVARNPNCRPALAAYAFRDSRLPPAPFSWYSGPEFAWPARATCWKKTPFCGKQIMLTTAPAPNYYQTCLWKAGQPDLPSPSALPPDVRLKGWLLGTDSQPDKAVAGSPASR